MLPPKVAIIGGGIGGIAMGVKLRRAGIESFTIFEAESGPGGTWRVNHYPGAEVDLVSEVYSFSFHSRNWTRNYARQKELLAYMEQTVEDLDLRRHFKFDTRIRVLRWMDTRNGYELTTEDGDKEFYDVVVTAVGFLSDPKLPVFDGMDKFEGASFHSARWNDDVDLAGKTIAIVGTGSTASQIVPMIAPDVKRLYLFQREPGWVLPKADRDFTAEELEHFSRSRRRKLRRLKSFFLLERTYHFGGEVYRVGTKRNLKGEAIAREYIDQVFKDRPDLKALVTPAYPFSGKRRIVSSDYYPALLRKNVQLVPHAVSRITHDGVVDVTGIERKIQVLVVATGFKASDYLSSLEVYGRNGRDLHAQWKNGACGFLGTTIPGFPNLYTIYGPNTNGGGPVTFMHERQAEYIVRDVKRLMRSGAEALEVRRSFVIAYNRWLQRRLADTAWATANNYMKGPSGTIVTQWPEGMILYWFLLRSLRRVSTRASVSNQP
jgi:cation diffusion facilitator CzcD-associated flavoprotein CzcO